MELYHCIINRFNKEAIFRFLGNEDIDSAIDLRNMVFDGIKQKDWFACATREDFEKAIIDGFGIGCYINNELVGCAFCILRDTEYDVVMEYNKEIAAVCADFSDVYVHMNYRGAGLHAILERLITETCIKQGKHKIICTVAQDNVYSMKNFLQAGYRQKKTAVLYGGLNRIVMEKDLTNFK